MLGPFHSLLLYMGWIVAHKGQVAGGVLHLPRGVAPAEGGGGWGVTRERLYISMYRDEEWGEVRWGKQPKWNKMMRKSWPGVENLSQQAKQQKIDSKRKRAMTFRSQLSVSAEWITDMSREREKTVKRQPIGRGRGTRVVILAYFTHCTPDDCPWLLIPDDSYVPKKKNARASSQGFSSFSMQMQ